MLSERYRRLSEPLKKMGLVLEQILESKTPKLEKLNPSLDDKYFPGVVEWEAGVECAESYVSNYKTFQTFYAHLPSEDRHYIVWMLVLNLVDRFVDFRARTYGVTDPETIKDGYRRAEEITNMNLENSVHADVSSLIKSDVINDSTVLRNL